MKDQRYKPKRTMAVKVVRVTRFILRHWLFMALALFTAFIALPFIAPMLMHIGWTSAANVLYDFYGLWCHQMAHRSYFLFGEQVSYLPEHLPVPLTGQMSADTLELRAFRGSELIGWKVAWSDRMITMYGGLWIGGVIYAGFSRKRIIKPFPIWLVMLAVLPMGVDGFTHVISDFGGLTEGFRYTNDWLMTLTGNIFSPAFYSGDTLGTFNSWMRIITGLLFGLGMAGLGFPIIGIYMRHNERLLTRKLTSPSPLKGDVDNRSYI